MKVRVTLDVCVAFDKVTLVERVLVKDAVSTDIVSREVGESEALRLLDSETELVESVDFVKLTFSVSVRGYVNLLGVISGDNDREPLLDLDRDSA